MSRLNHSGHSREARLKRLATAIGALAEKDKRRIEEERKNAAIRSAAALELHAICCSFVTSLNGLLGSPQVVLDPPDFSEVAFRDDGPNLFQVNVRGRILQVAFEACPGLVSTEDFRIPYTLEGSVRAYNQDLLDQDLIEEQLVFYTIDRQANMWRFFDPRTYRSGPFDQDYLISLMEQVI